MHKRGEINWCEIAWLQYNECCTREIAAQADCIFLVLVEYLVKSKITREHNIACVIKQLVESLDTVYRTSDVSICYGKYY